MYLKFAAVCQKLQFSALFFYSLSIHDASVLTNLSNTLPML